MESPNSLYNNINNTNKDGIESENLVIPSNFLLSTKEIIARFPHNKRVGHYLLGRKLGEGSFAKVKEGLHTLTGQKVAIKVIDKKKAKEDAYVSKNMRREGKLLQMIIHPNIIQLYELMETENSYYLVTELCEGGDLMDYICARKHLSETCTRKFIRQIISAVDYLHRIGILHRDLKIENLLLDKNLNIKLIDFGLSNYTKSELCITQCGSPAYAAPELLAHKKYGSKVDVWSIGVNMYAMLTGNLPFTVEPFNIKALYNKMMKNEMNAIPEHLSKSGEDLLRKLLNPDPSKRISLKEAMEHPWINEGFSSVLKPFPYPNKPTEEQVNPTILRYMNSNMEFNVNEIAENIKSNKPSSSLATYYLLLNKVKTMLLKIDPKKDKKPGTDLKSAARDLKPTVKPSTQQSTPQNIAQPTLNVTTPNTNQQLTNNVIPTITNGTRTVKTPGATNINITTNSPAPNSNGNSVGYSTLGKSDAANAVAKFNGSKTLERNLSPMTTLTNANTNINNTNNNTIPASTFAGAIKSLTQKYKTMQLSNSVENNNTNNNSNSSYKTTYIHTATANTNNANLNNSANENGSNNLSNHSDNTSTSNSDSASSSDDNNKVATNGVAGQVTPTSTSAALAAAPTTTSNSNANGKTGTLSNRNSIATPTALTTKLTNSHNLVNSLNANVEWTQVIKLNNAGVNKIKSDLNNNSNDFNNNTNSSSKELFNDQSTLIHLTQSSLNGVNVQSIANGLTSSNMSPPQHVIPNISFPAANANNNSNNGTTNSSPTSNINTVATGATTTANSLVQPPQPTSRLNKSPIMKKLSSPITLPAIEQGGRSTPQ